VASVLVPQLRVGFVGWPVAPLAGAVFENAPGIGRPSVVNAHQLPPSASVEPLPLTARTCQE